MATSRSVVKSPRSGGTRSLHRSSIDCRILTDGNDFSYFALHPSRPTAGFQMSHEQLESCVDTQVGEVRGACVEKRIIDDAALDLTCARLVSSLARRVPVSQAHFYACAFNASGDSARSGRSWRALV